MAGRPGGPRSTRHINSEHGIDLFGTRYAFRGAFCSNFGFHDIGTCSIPPSFLTAVNVGTVWGAIALGAVLGRARPVVALSGYGIPLVNAVTHIVGVLIGRSYNPGLLTALLLFLPACAWALSEGLRQGIRRSGLAAIVLGGVATHAVLLASLGAHLQGWISTSSLDGFQILNTFMPLAIVSGVWRIANRGPNRPAKTVRNF